MADKEKIVAKIIEFGKNINYERPYTPNKEANALVTENRLAWLFAVINDQGMKAEKVWAIPYELKKRLGHLEIKKLAQMSDEELLAIYEQKPKLHRFNKKMAKWVISACNLILQKYDGKVENLWKDIRRSDELQSKLDEFEGISQKKAAMATNDLVNRFGVPVQDKSGIDIAYDVHVRRVFLRSGLAEKDEQWEMITAARNLNPNWPGELDVPAWDIGRKYCHPTKPDCNRCPIDAICPKFIERGSVIKGI